MSDFVLRTTVGKAYGETIEAVRSGLKDQGFGVLTEIDLAATLDEKIGATVDPQTILGACRPELAYEALRAHPAIATLLPCNVVVRQIDDSHTAVEAFDPLAMIALAAPADGPAGDSAGDGAALVTVAQDAHRRLSAVIDHLA